MKVERYLSLKDGGRRGIGLAQLGLEGLQLGNSLIGARDKSRSRQLWWHQASQGLVASLCLGLLTALRDKAVLEVGQEVEQTEAIGNKSSHVGLAQLYRGVGLVMAESFEELEDSFDAHIGVLDVFKQVPLVLPQFRPNIAQCLRHQRNLGGQRSIAPEPGQKLLNGQVGLELS